MDSDRWRRVEAVLDRALMSDPSNWPELLDDSCSGDPELRAEVGRCSPSARLPNNSRVATRRGGIVARGRGEGGRSSQVDYCTTLPPAM